MKKILLFLLLPVLAFAQTKNVATGTGNQVLVGRGTNGADFWQDATNKAQISLAVSGSYVPIARFLGSGTLTVNASGTIPASSAAFSATSAFATSAQGTLADNAIPKTSGTGSNLTATGTLAVTGSTSIISSLRRAVAQNGVLVSGAGSTIFNGLYIADGESDGVPSYSGAGELYRNEGVWNLYVSGSGGYYITYAADFPWLVQGSWSEDGTDAPSPSFSQYKGEIVQQWACSLDSDPDNFDVGLSLRLGHGASDVDIVSFQSPGVLCLDLGGLEDAYVFSGTQAKLPGLVTTGTSDLAGVIFGAASISDSGATLALPTSGNVIHWDSAGAGGNVTLTTVSGGLFTGTRTAVYYFVNRDATRSAIFSGTGNIYTRPSGTLTIAPHQAATILQFSGSEISVY